MNRICSELFFHLGFAQLFMPFLNFPAFSGLEPNAEGHNGPRVICLTLKGSLILWWVRSQLRGSRSSHPFSHVALQPAELRRSAGADGTEITPPGSAWHKTLRQQKAGQPPKNAESPLESLSYSPRRVVLFSDQRKRSLTHPWSTSELL